MIESFLKLTALAAATALLALTVKKQTPELSLALTVAGCCAAALIALSFARPLVELIRSLSEKAGLQDDLTAALYKTMGVSLLARLCSAVCQDAGQGALAKTVETAGALLCLCLAVPLLQAALAMIEKML